MPLIHVITEKDEYWVYAGVIACPAAVGEVVATFDAVIPAGAIKALLISSRDATVHHSYCFSSLRGRLAGANVIPLLSGSRLDGAQVYIYNLINTANNVSVLLHFIVSR